MMGVKMYVSQGTLKYLFPQGEEQSNWKDLFYIQNTLHKTLPKQYNIAVVDLSSLMNLKNTSSHLY